jgi:hypothetical protein
MPRTITWRANSGDAWVGLVFGLICLPIGVIAALFGAYMWISGYLSADWPSVPAKILTKTFQTPSRGGKAYTSMDYEFTATNGIAYRSRGSVGGHYSQSDTIKIKYNPKRPTWTVIDARRDAAIARIALPVGGAWTLVWGYLFVSSVLQIRRRVADNRDFEARRAAKDGRGAERRAMRRRARQRRR